MERPLILISNDDGVQAKGLYALIDMVKKFGDVFVVAPNGARSGASMSISSHTPVRNKLIKEEEGVTIWSCSGTPIDCVKMAFEVLLPRRPDIVLGGINHGNNCAINAHYSGTMSVAIEGCIKYVPSAAISSGYLDEDANFEAMRPVVERIVEYLLKEGLPEGVCLNVNTPPRDEFKGIKNCKNGYGRLARRMAGDGSPSQLEILLDCRLLCSYRPSRRNNRHLGLRARICGYNSNTAGFYCL